MSKFKIFWYMRVIYIKRKLRTCTIQIQKEKVWFFCKKSSFFEIFDFFQRGTLWCRNYQKKFFLFFKNFKNKPQKWLSWDHSNTNRNKVMNFGGLSTYPAETARLFMVIRAIMPPLPKIGLTFTTNFKFLIPTGLFIIIGTAIWGFLEALEWMHKKFMSRQFFGNL